MTQGDNILELVNKLFEKVGFHESESKIYALLVEKKTSLSIREISEELGLSVRTVRERVRSLCRKNLLKREIVEKKWLEYKYRARSPREVWTIIKKKIERAIEEIDNELSTSQQGEKKEDVK
ncbi:MAG: transcriptional regulator [Candidatus Syntrophoarchaeum sp. WYZ-LMO15]|nr:MAG: transcriptional regulator [Candidatus Syntrophoarchaeum sp. WYZ-LMO15]